MSAALNTSIFRDAKRAYYSEHSDQAGTTTYRGSDANMTSEEQRLISQVTASFRAFSGTTGALRLRITSPSQVEAAAKPSLHEELRLIYDEHTIRRDESSSSLSRVLPGAYAGRGLLTRGECETLMREAIDRGMRHVEQGRRCGTSIKVKADGSVTDARLRDCTRTELLHPELADKMFERLRPHLESEVTVDGSESAHALGLPASDPMLHGVWRPSRVNPMIRICRYPGDGRGHFGPHQDSSFEVGPHERSLLTINGYLNALPEGAADARASSSTTYRCTRTRAAGSPSRTSRRCWGGYGRTSRAWRRSSTTG